MSHEDFAAYMSDGRAIGGYNATLVVGFDCLHILELDRATEIPLVFAANEGFESRVERVVGAVDGWARSQRSAAA
jgi:hypothetical protein